MSLSSSDYNILGSIINDTWGRSNEETAGALKISARIVGENKITVTCMVVVNLLNRSDMQKEAEKAYDQLNKLCNEYLKQVKKSFKVESGRSLKTKEHGHDTSIELINMSAYSQKGTALVRCVYNFEVG